MQLNKKIIISVAGSGKTTTIIKDATSKDISKRILITTYTIENTNKIKEKIIKKLGYIPINIEVNTYFSFLLEHGARPYQNYLISGKRIEGIAFMYGRIPRVSEQKNPSKYYMLSNDIDRNLLSKFIVRLNEVSNDAVVKRLELIYDYIYIDEVQDLSGYDFDLLEILLKSSINLLIVGDNRQATFSTNNNPRLKQYRGHNIIKLFQTWEKQKLCDLEYNNDCYRCIQSICDLASSLYPSMTYATSKNTRITEHDGIFLVSKKDVSQYIEIYKPQILKYDSRANVDGINYGKSKGLDFKRTLIYPTKNFEKFIETGDIKHIENIIDKIYVALTRAEQSVAIVTDTNSYFKNITKYKLN
ncbi:MAG TPA: UvrD-helicase domain-containing protein [Gallicola sp.]|nr:UvrD-helicase domain-containing protein [Gallicola sp.]